MYSIKILTKLQNRETPYDIATIYGSNVYIKRQSMNQKNSKDLNKSSIQDDEELEVSEQDIPTKRNMKKKSKTYGVSPNKLREADTASNIKSYKLPLIVPAGDFHKYQGLYQNDVSASETYHNVQELTKNLEKILVSADSHGSKKTLKKNKKKNNGVAYDKLKSNMHNMFERSSIEVE